MFLCNLIFPTFSFSFVSFGFWSIGFWFSFLIYLSNLNAISLPDLNWLCSASFLTWWLLSDAAVDILCCEIRTTTKVLPSMKKRGMLTTCAAFSPQQWCLRRFRLFFFIWCIFIYFTFDKVSFITWIVDETFGTYTDQVKKMMHIIRQYQLPLQKYMAMMDLQVAGKFLWFCARLILPVLFMLQCIEL